MVWLAAQRTGHRAPSAHNGQNEAHHGPPDVLQGPYAVLPATRKAAIALSALCRAARQRRRMAVVRFALTSNAPVALGVMVPLPAAAESDLDSFLLFKVPWGDEYARLVLDEHDELAVRLLHCTQVFAASRASLRGIGLASLTSTYFCAHAHAPPPTLHCGMTPITGSGAQGAYSHRCLCCASVNASDFNSLAG